MRRSTVTTPVYLGIRGTVVALDRDSGAELWRTPLKGWNFVNLTLDGDNLFATTYGEIYCLDPVSGHIRWNNPLRGLGYGLVSIAGASNTALAAQYQNDVAAGSTAAATAST
jgi:outer membrane protein assembly factor BamB